MKKTLGIVALAVCAMTITSCGAPSISIEDAKVEANQIRAHMNQNGDYVAGKKLEFNYRIYQQSETMGMKESTEAKGYVHVDLDETAPYVRTYSENYEVVEGYGEKESHSASAEAWTYVSGMHVVFGYEYKVDGQVSDSGETTVAMSNAETELLEDIQEAYYEISKVFEGAVESIFTYLSAFTSEEALAKAGVKLGSYGPGSLVVTENVSAKNGGAWAKSNTTIEFADYKLSAMKSSFDQGNEMVKSKGDLEYTFKYDSCPKKY